MQALWGDLLRCQVDLTFSLELPFYYTSPAWLGTPSVVDLGTGNGYYLARLRNLFPEKHFTGVDVDFAASKGRDGARHDCNGIEFVEKDLFSLCGAYRFVLSRLVAQHLPSVPDFVRHVASLLEPGGTFLSVEPADGLRTFFPACPAIQGLYRNFIAARREQGFDREAGLTIASIAEECGLEVLRTSAVPIPSTLPGHRQRFVQFHRLIFDIFEKEYGVSAERGALVDELEAWERNPNSYTQLGIQVGLFRKRNTGPKRGRRGIRDESRETGAGER
jgi:SAM-dependent methyltransferase